MFVSSYRWIGENQKKSCIYQQHGKFMCENRVLYVVAFYGFIDN